MQIDGNNPHSVSITTPVETVKENLTQIDPNNDFVKFIQKKDKKIKNRRTKLKGKILIQAIISFLTLSYPLYFSAQELCTEFGVQRNTISVHLNRLHKEEKVEKIKIKSQRRGRPIVKYKIMTPSSNKGPPAK